MLVTRVRIFCTALFTNNNIKVVIQINAFLMDLKKPGIYTTQLLTLMQPQLDFSVDFFRYTVLRSYE